MPGKVQVVFDCTDPDSLAKFYAEAIGYKLESPPEGFSSWHEALKVFGVPEEEWNDTSAIVDREGNGPRIFFQRIDTSKPAKNRLHIDINASKGRTVSLEERKAQVRSEVERISKLGATKQKEWDEGDNEFWVVMLDPEGNEFCVQ
jgi:hypothetical protein